ncbi:MAG: hypothetical protein WA160_13470 [Pseudobdellovibrio sp.]
MRFLILIIFSLSSFLVFARGGGMDSGGEDNRNILFGSAWFLGDQPVRYCIEMASDFGVTKNKAQQDIESAAKIWRAYISQKQVFSGSDKKEGLYPSTTYQYLQACNSSVDLIFYLGINNSVTDEQKKLFENPTAFAHRESFDVVKGWGKGWIWVSSPKGVYPGANFPDWTRTARLHGTFLHELGHVYGNGHVDGTIMEETLTSWMQFSPEMDERAVAVLTQIDDIKEMYICDICAFDFKGNFANAYNIIEQDQLFKTFVGRSAQGKIKTHFKYTPAENVNIYHLFLEDDLGVADLSIQLSGAGSKFDLVGDLFSVIRRTSPASVGGYSRTQVGRSMLGQINLNGQKKTVMINCNSSDEQSPLFMSLVEDGKVTRLFSAALLGMDCSR